MTGVSTIVWAEPGQADFVREVARSCGLRVVGAGSPMRGQAAAVAGALDVPLLDDLRAVLTTSDCGLVLLLAIGDFGADPGAADTGALLAARSRGVRVISLEPIPGSASELSAGRWNRPRAGVMPADCVRFAPGWISPAVARHASEVLTAFGLARSMSLTWMTPERTGTLGARVLGAMEAVRALMGEPESIDASYAWPQRTPGLHPLPGETLRDLRGDLTANIRFSDGRGASLLVSDQGGVWRRQCTLLGERGALGIGDEGFTWVDGAGNMVDSWTRESRDHPIAESLIEQLAERPDAGDLEAPLAMAQAALLSARTGQPESPGMIRRIFAATA